MPNPSSNYINTCTDCDSNCTTCIGSSTNCLTCSSDKKIQYDSSSLSFSCVTGSVSNELVVPDCIKSKYIYKGECLSSCPDTSIYRKWINDDCAACDTVTTGGHICNQYTSVISRCAADYGIDSSVTPATCYYCNQNSFQCCKYGQAYSSGSCAACTDSTNCERCSAISLCTQCISTHFANQVGTCITNINFCNVPDYSGSSCVQCSTDTSSGVVHKYWDSAAAVCVSGSCTTSNTHFFTSNGAKVCSGCDSACTECSKPQTNFYCENNCTSKYNRL